MPQEARGYWLLALYARIAAPLLAPVQGHLVGDGRKINAKEN
jgi:hypothetical protein